MRNNVPVRSNRLQPRRNDRLTPQEWKHLVGDEIRIRRQQLGIRSMRSAADQAGLGEATWRMIETGARQIQAGIVVAPNPGPDTKAAIARVLKWRADSIDRLLVNEEPTLQDPDEVEGAVGKISFVELRDQIEVLNRRVERNEKQLRDATFAVEALKHALGRETGLSQDEVEELVNLPPDEREAFLRDHAPEKRPSESSAPLNIRLQRSAIEMADRYAEQNGTEEMPIDADEVAVAMLLALERRGLVHDLPRKQIAVDRTPINEAKLPVNSTSDAEEDQSSKDGLEDLVDQVAKEAKRPLPADRQRKGQAG